MSNQDDQDYIYSSWSGTPGSSMGGAFGYGEYLRKQQEDRQRHEALSRDLARTHDKDEVRHGGSVADPAPRSGGSWIGLVLFGAIVGGVLGLGAGAAVVGALIGGVAALMLAPVLVAVLWVTGWVLRIAIWAAVLLGALWLVASLLGGA